MIFTRTCGQTLHLTAHPLLSIVPTPSMLDHPRFCMFDTMRKGFHNQVEHLFSAVLLSMYLNCTLVPPNWFSNYPAATRRPNIRCTGTASLLESNVTCAHVLPFGELLNSEAFASGMRQHVRIAEMPPFNGVRRLTTRRDLYRIVQQNLSRDVMWSQLRPVGATHSLSVIRLPALVQYPSRNWVNNHLSFHFRSSVRRLRQQFSLSCQPSLMVAHYVQLFRQSMGPIAGFCVQHAAHGCSTFAYLGLHWRVGEDLQRHVTGPLNVSHLLQTVLSLLPVTSERTLWLAGDIDQDIITAMQNSGYHPYSNTAVAGRPTHREVLACIERFMLQSASTFLGMWQSTLSLTVYEGRQALNLQSSDYLIASGKRLTQPCRPDQICSMQRQTFTTVQYQSPVWTFSLQSDLTLQMSCFEALSGVHISGHSSPTDVSFVPCGSGITQRRTRVLVLIAEPGTQRCVRKYEGADRCTLAVALGNGTYDVRVAGSISGSAHAAAMGQFRRACALEELILDSVASVLDDC